MIVYDPRSLRGVLFRWRGTVAPGIWGRCLFVVSLSVVLVLIRYLGGVTVGFTSDAHAVVSMVLSLLLAFRTQFCADRHSEGHKLVDTCTSALLSLVRVVAVHVTGSDDTARMLRSDVRRLSVALFLAIKQYVRKEYAPEEYGALLNERELEALAKMAERPQVVAVWLSQRISTADRATRLSQQMARKAEDLLHVATDAWGGIMRIASAPIPFAYAHHIRLFVHAYVLTVPFILISTTGALTPVAVLLVAYGMFGVEEIGLEIEEPFGRDANDLPMDQIGSDLMEQCSETLEAEAQVREWHSAGSSAA